MGMSSCSQIKYHDVGVIYYQVNRSKKHRESEGGISRGEGLWAAPSDRLSPR